MPTDLPTRIPPRATSRRTAFELELVALFALLPWFACMLLVHAYPAIAGAFVLLGQLS